MPHRAASVEKPLRTIAGFGSRCRVAARGWMIVTIHPTRGQRCAQAMPSSSGPLDEWASQPIECRALPNHVSVGSTAHSAACAGERGRNVRGRTREKRRVLFADGRRRFGGITFGSLRTVRPDHLSVRFRGGRSSARPCGPSVASTATAQPSAMRQRASLVDRSTTSPSFTRDRSTPSSISASFLVSFSLTTRGAFFCVM